MRLTEREEQVLRRVLRRQPQKLIASELGIAVRTVQCHRETGLRKLGGLDALLPYALRVGWLDSAEHAASWGDGYRAGYEQALADTHARGMR